MGELQEMVFKGHDNQVLTNSLLVAEKFGKEHSDVLKAIDALVCKMPENQCEGYFADSSIETPQPNGGVRHSRVIVMNRDGFTLLVMGFTGKKALAFKLEYIAAFNAMEKELKNANSINGNVSNDDSLEAATVKMVKHISEMDISDQNKVCLMSRLLAQESTNVIPTTQKMDIKNLPSGLENEKRTTSATRLLKRYKSNITTTEFNDIMVDIGYMKKEYGYRFKTFNVLVDAGLKYGVNVNNIYYPGKTTPMYFEDTFACLLCIIEDSIN